MYPTEYIDPSTLGKPSGPYVGGFCQLWYTPIENVLTFHPVNPVTQQMDQEPDLKNGAAWYGPIKVPEKTVGWEQDQEDAAAGTYFKNKVTGFIPGNTENNHINIGNMTGHQFVIVGKLRAGGFYVLLGSEDAGLDLKTFVTSGIGSAGMPGTKLEFLGESTHNAIIVTTFTPAITIAALTGGMAMEDGNLYMLEDDNNFLLETP